ncbi:hypothetical protein [Neisseria dentiae]|nr:hypothetical protein [Neisseria dentiae]STZ50453.1 Uncharacterised protein [Neisseria dentiae]
MIRYNIYTVYQDKEYRVRNNNGLAKLISNDADDLKKGFIEKIPDTKNLKYTPEQLAKKVYTLNVSPSEIGDVYKISTHALYQGYEFWIEHETNDGCYILSASTTRQPLLDKLGFTEVERGLFEKKIKKEEADLVYEKKRLITDFFD